MGLTKTNQMVAKAPCWVNRDPGAVGNVCEYLRSNCTSEWRRRTSRISEAAFPRLFARDKLSLARCTHESEFFHCNFPHRHSDVCDVSCHNVATMIYDEVMKLLPLSKRVIIANSGVPSSNLVAERTPTNGTRHGDEENRSVFTGVCRGTYPTSWISRWYCSISSVGINIHPKRIHGNYRAHPKVQDYILSR